MIKQILFIVFFGVTSGCSVVEKQSRHTIRCANQEECLQRDILFCPIGVPLTKECREYWHVPNV